MNKLQKIIEIKKEEVKKLRSEFSISRFSDLEFFDKKCIDFRSALVRDNRLGLIAEIKKASPSKGVIRDDFNHIKIAEEYFKGGANAISILTDKKFFQGNISFLNDIAKFKEAPLLRKDFIIDEYQVFEAKANGADAILLISETLSKMQINELTHAAIELGLAVLLEVHSKVQLVKIDFKLNKIIGINNRNLEDFSTDLKTTENVIKSIPNDIVIVSESGIKRKEDLQYIMDAGASAALVGEHFMTKENLYESLSEFKEWINEIG